MESTMNENQSHPVANEALPTLSILIGHIGNSSADRALLVFLAYTLTGCSGAPSRNILGSYFPSWMVCALAGIAVALVMRVILKASGFLEELPAPVVVLFAVAFAATFALWLRWLW